MTPYQMLEMVRRLISDEQGTGYTEGGTLEEPEGTQELLNYLDRAVDEYSKRLMEEKSVDLIKTLTVEVQNRTLPDDFLGFCGAVPVTVQNNTINYYSDEPNISFKYFARLPYVSSYSISTNVPYSQKHCMRIIALAAIYALNKHEFNVSQDLMLLGYGGNNANGRQQTQRRT